MSTGQTLWLLARLGSALLLTATLISDVAPPALAGPSAVQPTRAGAPPNHRLQAQFLAQQRAYPRAAVPPGARAAALAARPRGLSTQSNGAAWTPLVPAPVDVNPLMDTALAGTTVSGRLTAVLPVGSSIYVGAAQGGVWKSTNQGASWAPLADNQASLAIGSLATDSTGALYAGTGEANFPCDSYHGAVVLKSTDGGVTWTQLGASTFTGLTVGKVIVHPTNPSLIYATAAYGYTGFCDAQANLSAAEGVYESTDGGQTWSLLPAPTTTTQGLGVPTDLLMNPNNPAELYAAFDATYPWLNPGGVYKSTDGGAGWTLLGLPTTGAGRISLALSGDGERCTRPLTTPSPRTSWPCTSRPTMA